MFSSKRLKLRASDGIAIPGIVTRAHAVTRGGILMLHGITTHKNEYANFYGRLAAKLAQRGIESLRIDFRGHGDSRARTRDFTIASQVVDTVAAVDWLSEHAQHKRVTAILGSSFGALPALVAGTLRNNNLQRLLLVVIVMLLVVVLIK